MLDTHVLDLQRLQIAPRLRNERADALHGIDFVGHMREHSRLVAAAGADLEHAVHARSCAHQLRHSRHDIRLRYRLSGADRQRAILVRSDGEGLFDKDMARYRPHRGQHDLVLDALLAQAFDHASTRALGGHPDTVESSAHRCHVDRRHTSDESNHADTRGNSSWSVRSICSGVTDTYPCSTA